MFIIAEPFSAGIRKDLSQIISCRENNHKQYWWKWPGQAKFLTQDSDNRLSRTGTPESPGIWSDTSALHQTEPSSVESTLKRLVLSSPVSPPPPLSYLPFYPLSLPSFSLPSLPFSLLESQCICFSKGKSIGVWLLLDHRAITVWL